MSFIKILQLRPALQLYQCMKYTTQMLTVDQTRTYCTKN